MQVGERATLARKAAMREATASKLVPWLVPARGPSAASRMGPQLRSAAGAWATSAL
jgi:hypothetical protein